MTLPCRHPYERTSVQGDRIVDDTHLLAAGHDALVHYFTLDGGAWVWKGSVDKPTKGKVAKKATGGVSAARAMWANKTDLGSVDGAKGSKLASLHQNSICGIKICDAETFSTCGYDGRVVLWDLACLQTATIVA